MLYNILNIKFFSELFFLIRYFILNIFLLLFLGLVFNRLLYSLCNNVLFIDLSIIFLFLGFKLNFFYIFWIFILYLLNFILNI